MAMFERDQTPVRLRHQRSGLQNTSLHALAIFLAGVTAACSAVAQGAPTVRNNIFIETYKQFAKKAENQTCQASGPGVPDGGPLCRNFSTPCITARSLTESDKMNGTRAIRVVCVQYNYYLYGWNDEKYCVYFYQTDAGWQVGGQDSADENDFRRSCRGYLNR
jgi:hypothetical protein